MAVCHRFVILFLVDLMSAFLCGSLTNTVRWCAAVHLAFFFLLLLILLPFLFHQLTPFHPLCIC